MEKNTVVQYVSFFLLRGAELVDEHVHTQLDAVRREDKGKMDRIKKS